DHYYVGHLIVERRRPRVMHDRVGEYVPASRGFEPAEGPPSAIPPMQTWRTLEGVARTTALNEEALLGAPFPKRLRRGVGLWQGHLSGRAHQRALLSTRAEDGGAAGPETTRQCSAPRTCAVL